MNGSNSNTSGNRTAALSFTGDPKCVSRKAREEIARDLKVTFPATATSDIDGSVTEPSDKTKIWWAIDPTTGARIGNPKKYDPNTATWVELGAGQKGWYLTRKRRNGTLTLNAGNSAYNVNFENIETVHYHVNVTPSTFVAGLFGSAPANMNNFGWIVTNRANNQFTIHVFNGQSGMSLFWEVAEIEAEKLA